MGEKVVRQYTFRVVSLDTLFTSLLHSRLNAISQYSLETQKLSTFRR